MSGSDGGRASKSLGPVAHPPKKHAIAESPPFLQARSRRRAPCEAGPLAIGGQGRYGRMASEYRAISIAWIAGRRTHDAGAT